MASVPPSVAQAIQDHVLDFERETKNNGNPPFYMRDLTAAVLAKVVAAPDSPGRVLRMLKRQGFVDYRVEDRARSLYRFV
jgi:hypothetical protein